MQASKQAQVPNQALEFNQPSTYGASVRRYRVLSRQTPTKPAGDFHQHSSVQSAYTHRDDVFQPRTEIGNICFRIQPQQARAWNPYTWQVLPAMSTLQ